MTTTVLLSGATGYIGGHVLTALQALPDLNVRALVRDPRTITPTERLGVVAGDLNDAQVVRQSMRDVDIVVHTAAYIGDDRREQNRTNVHGLAIFVDAAVNERVPRFISIGTTAVYGTGPHRVVGDNHPQLHPESTLTASRLRGEQLVLDAGGLSIRPHLVYGDRDSMVLPAVLRFTAALDALIDDGRARVSTIRADRLGLLVAAAATVPEHALPHEKVLHAAEPIAVSVADILVECGRALGTPTPTRTVSWPAARERAAELGITEHRASLLALDAQFDGEALWSLAGLPEDASFILDEPSTRWYRSYLAEHPIPKRV